MTGGSPKQVRALMLRQVAVILFGFAVVVAIAAFAAKTGLRSMEESYGRLQELVTQNNAKFAYMTDMRDAIRERMLLTYDIVHTADPFDLDELAQEYSAKARDFIRARDKLLALRLTDGQRAQIERQRGLLAVAQKILNSVVERARNGSVADAGELIHRARLANEKVLHELQVMRDEQTRLAQKELLRSTAVYHHSRERVLLLAAVALCLSTLVIGFIVWRIVSQGRALALANQALESANQGLEQRVERRTQELMATRAENMRMGAELDVGRRLQQMLLPSAEELGQVRELEIAAFMEPAAEVGGDYYDVLPHADGLRIGIGDVTGHGLESGVVMLMTQSALRTLPAESGGDMAELLETLNRTIFNNVQRMGGEKFLSLAILDYQALPEGGEVRGRLRLAGQHESLILLRADGHTEVYDTDSLGFPIGLVDEVASFVDVLQLELRRGDTAVLYTDGITEAADEEHRLYGLDRLCEVLRNHVAEEVEAIKQAVIADVKRHIAHQTLFDDLTLVLRQR